MKLKILPGLKWTGTLRVLSSDTDSFVVQFDAKYTDPSVEFPFIYDRTVLSARQLEDWTGYRRDENHVELTTQRRQENEQRKRTARKSKP